jgi:hypothetical protein
MHQRAWDWGLTAGRQPRESDSDMISRSIYKFHYFLLSDAEDCATHSLLLLCRLVILSQSTMPEGRVWHQGPPLYSGITVGQQGLYHSTLEALCMAGTKRV